MRGVATLHIKQDGKYQLSAINNRGVSIKNCEYFLEFEAKFEKPSDTSKGLGRNPFVKKSEVKNLVGLSF
jgi:hypothetical protein